MTLFHTFKTAKLFATKLGMAHIVHHHKTDDENVERIVERFGGSIKQAECEWVQTFCLSNLFLLKHAAFC